MPYKLNKHIISVDSAKLHTISVGSPLDDTTIVPSLFQSHLLTAKNSKSEIHYTNYDYLVSGILLFLYILFVWMYVSNYKKLGQIIKGFYFSRYANQLSRDELAIGNRVSVFLSVFFVFTLTLFIGRILSYYGYHPSFLGKSSLPVVSLVTALFIILAYCIKFATIKLFGFIFNLQKEASDYMLTIFLFCNALGLFMLPVVIGITFVKQVSPQVFIYSGMGIIALFLFVRIIRGLIRGLYSSEISKIYLFLYLCALEILPFIILVKLFILYVK